MTAELAADSSAAPEIAMLAGPLAAVTVPPPAGGIRAGTGPAGRVASGPPTLGALSGLLGRLASAPECWWGLVRFDSARPLRIAVDGGPAHSAWLSVLPPGDAGGWCDCAAATMVAGAASEDGTVLRPGTVRVHGGPHRLRGLGPGYSVSLHARAGTR